MNRFGLGVIVVVEDRLLLSRKFFFGLWALGFWALGFWGDLFGNASLHIT